MKLWYHMSNTKESIQNELNTWIWHLTPKIQKKTELKANWKWLGYWIFGTNSKVKSKIKTECIKLKICTAYNKWKDDLQTRKNICKSCPWFGGLIDKIHIIQNQITKSLTFLKNIAIYLTDTWKMYSTSIHQRNVNQNTVR